MKGTAQEITICGKRVQIGDTVKVKYTSGARTKGGFIGGKIVELWCPTKDGHLQGRIESGWCFHDGDEIIEHYSA